MEKMWIFANLEFFTRIEYDMKSIKYELIPSYQFKTSNILFRLSLAWNNNTDCAISFHIIYLNIKNILNIEEILQILIQLPFFEIYCVWFESWAWIWRRCLSSWRRVCWYLAKHQSFVGGHWLNWISKWRTVNMISELMSYETIIS